MKNILKIIVISPFIKNVKLKTYDEKI